MNSKTQFPRLINVHLFSQKKYFYNHIKIYVHHMFYFIYSSIYLFFLLLIIPYFLIRTLLLRQRNKFKNLLGLGKFPKSNVWIHAVSFGEVLLADKLISYFTTGLKKNKTYSFTITTMNDLAYQQLKKKYQHAKNIHYSYLPFDFPIIINKFIRNISPDIWIIIEHDLWPNALKACRELNIKTFLVNADFKPKDQKSLRRYPFVTKYLYNLDYILTQNKQAHLVAKSLNLPAPTQIKNWGNLKYDLSIPKNISFSAINEKSKLNKLNKKLIVTLGSFHEKEEDLVLKNLPLSELKKDLRIIIIPRHANRAKILYKQLKLNFNCQLYSKVNKINVSTFEILLVDQMGISFLFYKYSDLVFIGDSFRPSQGGHNFLEPLLFKKPVAYGEYFRSFSDITPIFEKKKAVKRLFIKNLRSEISFLLNNKKERIKMGKKGHELLLKLAPQKEKMKHLFHLNMGIRK